MLFKKISVQKLLTSYLLLHTLHGVQIISSFTSV